MRPLFAPLLISRVTTGAFGASAEGLDDIAPTGSLRVAIGVGPAASPFWTTRDPATGKLRGVTVELAKAAAPSGSTIPWDKWVAEYSKIRDAIAATYPDIFHDFNARLWQPGGAGHAALPARWTHPD